MLIAQSKRKENIAEYLLYLFHIEFLIRALQLDLEKIKHQLINQYKVDEATKQAIEKWYLNLIKMMQKEHKEDAGHLQFVENLIQDVNEFHLRLIKSNKKKNYTNIYQRIYPILLELKQKNANSTNSVQIALDTIYGTSLLKIQQKNVSNETKKAVEELAEWLAALSKNYKDFETGDLEL